LVDPDLGLTFSGLAILGPLPAEYSGLPVVDALKARVTIADAEGKKLVEKEIADYESVWGDSQEAPPELKTLVAIGKPVPLTLTVTFDTRDLFGKVEASCPIMLSPSKK
jgi:hypothetical protein